MIYIVFPTLKVTCFLRFFIVKTVKQKIPKLNGIEVSMFA